MNESSKGLSVETVINMAMFGLVVCQCLGAGAKQRVARA